MERPSPSTTDKFCAVGDRATMEQAGPHKGFLGLGETRPLSICGAVSGSRPPPSPRGERLGTSKGIDSGQESR